MEEQSISNVIVALFQPRFKICWNITSKHPKWRFEGIFPSVCPYENFCKELQRLYTPPNLFGPWPYLLGRALWSSCSVAVVWLFSAVNFQMSLLEKVHSHTGCIFFPFLQWAFSNVSPNGLPERMHLAAFVMPFSTMNFQTSPQMACRRRRTVTVIAFVLLFYTLGFHMFPQIACIVECLVTLVAFVVFFSAVSFQMCTQIACLRGCIVTLVELVKLFSIVYYHTSAQTTCLIWCKVTLVAFFWLFSIVCFQMCPQITCPRGCIVALFTYNISQ